MLARASLRYLLRHPWLTALSVLGVALGVAVVVAVDLANASATRAFALSSEAVTGRATHQIVGGPGGVPTAVYRRLKAEGVEAAPVVEGYARWDVDSTRVFQVLGVDLFAEAAFRPYLGPRAGLDLPALLTVPGAALLSTETAAELGVAPGGAVPLRIEGRPDTAHVVGLLTPEDARSRSALQDLLVVDVATAQEWLGMTVGRGRGAEDGGPRAAAGAQRVAEHPPSALRLLPSEAGRLSRVDLLVPEGEAGERLLARVEAALPEGAAVRPATAQAAALETMTAAFRTNLAALSLLALVVGVFLIYNTVTFSVVQRRRLLGTYRALGVTRREVFRLVLAEALGVAAVGTAVGLVLGVALGGGLVRLVTQTIGDLYFVVRVRELALDPAALAKGAVLGLGATALAALRPAYEATTTPPAHALRRSTQEGALAERAGRFAFAGAAVALVGGALLFVPGGIGPAYAGLLLVIVGAALAAPWATRVFARAARPAAGRLFGPVGRMAARGIESNLSRTAVAVAALAVAVASTVGVGVMIRSFRATVVDWLGTTLQADVYVSPPSLVLRRGGGTLDPALARDLAALPGVAAADSVRVRALDTPRGQVDLFATPLDARRARLYRFKSGDPEAAIAAARRGAVLVSEPFGFRFDVTVGDTLRLPTDRGLSAFPIAGVYYDYGSDLGVVLMHDATFRRHFAARGLTGLALYAAPGVEPDALVARARALTAGRQALNVRSNRALRETSIALFDRTFLVTTVLRLLAVGVAFVGVLSALMALQLERRRELAVLRAQGMTTGEVSRLIVLQTGLMGLWAGLLAVPLGLLLAAVLVYVINVRSFGWTLAFQPSPDLWLQAVGLALAAALLAGLYPAWAVRRTDPALALREEG